MRVSITSSLLTMGDPNSFSSLGHRFSVQRRKMIVVEMLKDTLTSFHSIFLKRKVVNTFREIVFALIEGSNSFRVSLVVVA